MRMSFDVTIIGAGPAGSACARALVEAGLEVLVVEKEKFPREKPCCGLLARRAVSFVESRFGPVPSEFECEPKELRFTWSYTGRNFNELDGYNPFLSVRRDQLDHWLIGHTGATILENHEAGLIEQNNDRVRVGLISPEGPSYVDAKYVVCCAGANMRLRKMVAPDLDHRSYGAYMQKRFRGNFVLDDDFFYMSNNRKFTSAGFAWLCRKTEETLVGCGWAGKYNGYFENWLQFLEKRHGFHFMEVDRQRGCAVIPGNEKVFLGKNRVLFAGDAAGLGESWGVGITTALLSGEHAAVAISTASEYNLVNRYAELMQPVFHSIRESLGPIKPKKD